MLTKILSCGMSGTERAALDVAMERPLLKHGGYCQKGHIADDGAIDARYIAERFSDIGLVEVEETSYKSIVKRCLIDGDGALILRSGKHTRQGRTALSASYDLTLEGRLRPVITADPWLVWHIHKVLDWIVEHRVRHLFITGPNASERTGIYEKSLSFISDVVSQDFIRSHWNILNYKDKDL